MKNQLKKYMVITICTLTFLNAQAFDKPSKEIIGVFGFCDCQATNAKIKVIELSLNEDFTFCYVDNSNPYKPFALTGKWTQRDNKVYLLSNDNRKSFHRKWKLESDGRCIKSRYQANFRRICLMKPC